MKNYGLIRTAAAVPAVKVADTGHNANQHVYEDDGGQACGENLSQ